MTQHRECCCEEAEIECLNSDKVFRHFEDELPSGSSGLRLGNSYRNPIASEGGFNTVANRSGNLPYPEYARTNPGQAHDTITRPGSNNKSEHATTGMSCMLCQHALIMDFKRKAFTHAGFQFHDCSGADSSGCVGRSDTVCNQTRYYDWRANSGYVEEESMSSLYLHWKDYWYLERGSIGVPYSMFDEGTNFLLDTSTGENLETNKRFGYPNNQSLSNCEAIIPRKTDANYLCYPELKRVCNPLNPYFSDGYGRDPAGVPSNEGSYRTYLEATLSSNCMSPSQPGTTDFTPEMMQIYNGLESNKKRS